MIKATVIVTAFLFALNSHAQDTSSRKIHIGIEQDVLPYLTGGYFAGVWAGRDHIRVRAITAKVNRPDLITKKGFTNNRVTAYALLADYFLKENREGWWAGSGLVYWQSSIQTDKRTTVSHYTNWLLNGSAGYNFTPGKNFYISPWCGVHLKIAGDRQLPVDDKIFTPPLLNPEASVKLGVWL